MTNATASDPATLIKMTGDLIAAYVKKNHVRAAELPALIEAVHPSLAGMASGPEATPEPANLVPAVSIKKSITDEFIISLEDSRKFKSMKRYLSGLGMTPDEYRTKRGLPNDYPVTAPEYSAHRSKLAKTFGLGSIRRKR